jgi:hypothetical protein
MKKIFLIIGLLCFIFSSFAIAQGTVLPQYKWGKEQVVPSTVVQIEQRVTPIIKPVISQKRPIVKPVKRTIKQTKYVPVYYYPYYNYYTAYPNYYYNSNYYYRHDFVPGCLLLVGSVLDSFFYGDCY